MYEMFHTVAGSIVVVWLALALLAYVATK